MSPPPFIHLVLLLQVLSGATSNPRNSGGGNGAAQRQSLNNNCYFVQDCQNYACPAARNHSNVHNPTDIIAPLKAFEQGEGYTQYQHSMATAANIIKTFGKSHSGGGCQSVEGGLKLHTTLKYFCCFNTSELNAMANTIQAYALANPLELMFNRISCNGFDRSLPRNSFDFFALLTNTSQDTASAWMQGMENALRMAGHRVHKNRTFQTPFHSTLAEKCPLDFPVDSVLTAIRHNITSFQSVPMKLKWFFMGSPFHLFKIKTNPSNSEAVSFKTKLTTVFSNSEVASCGRLRIPQMTVTPRGLLLVAQCRDAGQSNDNMLHSKVVTKFSPDNGTTWEKMVVLTPQIGHSHGQVVYDAVRKQVLLQYQHHPNADPELNSTLYQRISQDDGQTWSSPIDITDKIKRCNPDAPTNMQVGTAGSKIQTATGRIMFLGHAKGSACRWWTDDGGETYNASAPYLGNEASVAEINDANGLYMNARGLAFSWKGNRTSFWSHDDGTTFSAPVECPVKEDADFGCSAGLVSIKTPTTFDTGTTSTPSWRRLFLSEPNGPERIGMTIHCSLDGGYTWPHSLGVGGVNESAAYSAMRRVTTEQGDEKILIVWEYENNFRSTTVETSWCSMQERVPIVED